MESDEPAKDCRQIPVPVIEKCAEADIAVVTVLSNMYNSAPDSFDGAKVAVAVDMMVDANPFPTIFLVRQPQRGAVRIQDLLLGCVTRELAELAVVVLFEKRDVDDPEIDSLL